MATEIMSGGDHIGEAYQATAKSLEENNWVVRGAMTDTGEIQATYAMPRVHAEGISAEEAAGSLALQKKRIAEVSLLTVI